MVDSGSPLYRVARCLSAVGNPLVTSTFMIGVTSFQFLDQRRAIGLMGMLVLCVIGPIIWWILRGVRRGMYSDYDVSQRKARETMYPIIILLLLIGSVALWATNQPRALLGGMVGAFVVSSAAFIVNRWIKISLHASFCFFYAIGSAALAWTWVAPLTVFAVLVTASRWMIGRHVWRELILGALLGCVAGSTLLVALGIV